VVGVAAPPPDTSGCQVLVLSQYWK
jgi:hypothetical protein